MQTKSASLIAYLVSGLRQRAQQLIRKAQTLPFVQMLATTATAYRALARAAQLEGRPLAMTEYLTIAASYSHQASIRDTSFKPTERIAHLSSI